MPSLVVVIGDAALDVRVVPQEPVRPGGDVPAAIGMHPGGQGANVAVRLARRGVRVRLVATIGDDASGAMLREVLGREGVDLWIVPADRSSAVVVLADPGGDRTMLSQRAPLLGSALDPDAIADAGWLIVSGYVLLEPSAGTLMSGVPPRRVVLGCSLSPGQADRWASRAASLDPDLVVLNVVEAAILAPGVAGAPALAREVGARLDAIVVVTRPDGATSVVAGETIETAPPTGVTVTDTTGAGDAFAAALIDGLMRTDWPPAPGAMREAMAEAGRLATAVTGVVGAQGRVEGEA